MICNILFNCWYATYLNVDMQRFLKCRYATYFWNVDMQRFFTFLICNILLKCRYATFYGNVDVKRFLEMLICNVFWKCWYATYFWILKMEGCKVDGDAPQAEEVLRSCSEMWCCKNGFPAASRSKWKGVCVCVVCVETSLA